MTYQWLTSWWNLIFLLPFALALFYLGLYTLSGITFGDADADVGAHFDADADGDFHIDHDVHVEAETELDAGAHAEMDTDAEAHAEVSSGHGPALSALQWLGVGRVPVSIVLMVLLLTWGWLGFIINVLMQAWVRTDWTVSGISVPAAAIGSILVTKIVVGLVAHWLPTFETTARRRHELLGSVGKAIFDINEKFGLASIRDPRGELYQVPCRVEAGSPTVAKGRAVKLVAYNAKEGIFGIIPWEAQEAARVAQSPIPG